MLNGTPINLSCNLCLIRSSSPTYALSLRSFYFPLLLCHFPSKYRTLVKREHGSISFCEGGIHYRVPLRPPQKETLGNIPLGVSTCWERGERRSSFPTLTKAHRCNNFLVFWAHRQNLFSSSSGGSSIIVFLNWSGLASPHNYQVYTCTTWCGELDVGATSPDRIILDLDGSQWD